MSSLNDLFYETHQEWQTDGPPKKSWLDAGPLFRAVNKTPRTDWTGGTVSGGSVKGLVPVRTGRNGNQGAAYSKVYTNAVGYSGVQFQQDLSEQWEVLRLSAKFLEVLKNPAALESGMSGLMDDMEQVVGGWSVSMSYLLWGDGRGGFGCGDGAYTITGNVIQLLNVNSARCFEKGDVLRLIDRSTYDAAARGVRPAARTGTLTIEKVNETTGELTVEEADISVAISGAANTDVISKDSYYPGADDTETGPNMAGIYTWLARTNTLAQGTLYGVDCSVRPERMAGRRINLTGTETPYEIVAEILQASVNAGAPIDMISVPSSQISALVQELASRNMLVKDVTVGVDKPQNLTMGVTASGVQWGEIRAALVADPYQIDPLKTAADDIGYAGLCMDDFGLTTTSGGISWKDWDGNGTFLVQKSGTQSLESAYGCFGAFRCENTGHQIYAGVGASA
jgi:hypothetical protein